MNPEIKIGREIEDEHPKFAEVKTLALQYLPELEKQGISEDLILTTPYRELCSVHAFHNKLARTIGQRNRWTPKNSGLLSNALKPDLLVILTDNTDIQTMHRQLEVSSDYVKHLRVPLIKAGLTKSFIGHTEKELKELILAFTVGDRPPTFNELIENDMAAHAIKNMYGYKEFLKGLGLRTLPHGRNYNVESRRSDFIRYIMENPGSSNREIAEALDEPLLNVKKRSHKLCETGILDCTFNGKNHFTLSDDFVNDILSELDKPDAGEENLYVLADRYYLSPELISSIYNHEKKNTRWDQNYKLVKKALYLISGNRRIRHSTMAKKLDLSDRELEILLDRIPHFDKIVLRSSIKGHYYYELPSLLYSKIRKNALDGTPLEVYAGELDVPKNILEPLYIGPESYFQSKIFYNTGEDVPYTLNKILEANNSMLHSVLEHIEIPALPALVLIRYFNTDKRLEIIEQRAYELLGKNSCLGDPEAFKETLIQLRKNYSENFDKMCSDLGIGGEFAEDFYNTLIS